MSRMSKSIAASRNTDIRALGNTEPRVSDPMQDRLFNSKNNAFFFIKRSLAQFTSLENQQIIV